MTGPKHQQSTQLAKHSTNFLRTSQGSKHRVELHQALLVGVADHLLPYEAVNITRSTRAQIAHLLGNMQSHFIHNAVGQVTAKGSMIARPMTRYNDPLVGIGHQGLYPPLSQPGLRRCTPWGCGRCRSRSRGSSWAWCPGNKDAVRAPGHMCHSCWRPHWSWSGTGWCSRSSLIHVGRRGNGVHDYLRWFRRPPQSCVWRALPPHACGR